MNAAMERRIAGVPISTVAEIPQVTDSGVGEVLSAERGALILTKSTCGACAAYTRDLAERQARGGPADLVIRKLVLDLPGAARFKLANPWLAEVTALPYTVLFVRGEMVDRFAASKGSYLVERLAMAAA